MPALAQDVFKIVLRGTVAGSQDWSTALWVRPFYIGPPPTPAQLQSIATALDGLAATMWATYKTQVTADTTFDETVVYLYPAGSTISTLSGTSTGRAAIVGTGVTPLPAEVSLVLSLRTATQTKRGRGRMYFPWVSGPLTAGHQLGAGTVTVLLGAFQTWVNAVAGYSSVPNGITSLTPVVVSFTGGDFHTITGIVVNSDPDTQRRRGHKIPVLSTQSATIP